MYCIAFTKKILLLYVCVFFINNICLSQSSGFRFENITNEQGIADRVINAIIQDAQGFIWIASIDGLTRYDGYNAIVYRHKNNDANSLSDNEVYALCTDGDGYLWIGTRNGLNRYDAYHDRFDTFLHDSADEHSLASNEIFSLAKDISGNIWIGTYNGGVDKLIKTEKGKGYKGSGYNFFHFKCNENDSNSISNNQVFSVCFDKAGRAWIGTSKGVNIIEAEKKITRLYADIKDENTIANNTANKIVAAADGSVWLCGRNMLDNVSIEKSNNGKITVKHFLPLLSDDKIKKDWAVNDLMIDRNKNYWVATNDEGVFKLTANPGGSKRSLENFVNDQSAFSLANTTVFSLYEDNAGIVWIGTAKGISKYIPSKARFNEARHFSSTFMQHRFVKALLCDKNKRLWIGSDSDTLFVANNNNGKYFLPLPSAMQFNQVNALCQSKVGDIYVATFTGGFFIIPNSVNNMYDTRQWININKTNSILPANNIYAVAEDKNGIIWLGTYTGLCNYEPYEKKLNKIYVSPAGNVVSSFIIRTVFVDDKNIVWCGTDEGIVLVKHNKVIQKFYANDKDSTALNNNRVTVIYQDRNKNIWVGTKAGLDLYNVGENNFRHFTPSDNLLVETVLSIGEDKQGNLWMGTNNGLVKFNIAAKKFTKYSVEDGLGSNEFEPNAVCNADELFYFGTANGLVSFYPSAIVSNNFIPPVVITDVKLLDKPLASFADTALINTYRHEKKLVLKYNQNFFSFEFAALSYNNSKANQYTYILEGVDKQWRSANTQNFAGYTDIRPGHYVFKVKASNNDGVWNTTPATVQVIIMSPWWQTWWFYTLCALVAVGIIYIIYRIRIQQVLKLYRLRSSIAKDLHDDVGSALSSIALLSNISEKARTKASLKPEEIFTRIGDTSKRMINLMDDIVWSVNPDNDRFSNMLVRMREYAAEMLEPKDIDLTFHTAEDIDELRIPMQMRKDYFLIFKEAINNLVKYAECDVAFISIKKENKNIVTIIKDNGKGFDAAIIHAGNGLKNMQQRAAAIKSKLIIETTRGSGTVITLLMPV